jgi:GNAT superfamily N-acetyltransferase
VDLRVTRADEATLPTVSSILSEATAWLREHTGHPMWEAHEVTVAGLLEEYRPEDVHLAWDGGEAVATFILMPRDEVFWPEVPRGEAAFLHKLAVRRAWAGREVPARIVAWAKDEALARGARFIRLDCDAERPKLCEIYEGLGFTCVRRGIVRTFATCFYEMPLPGTSRQEGSRSASKK